MASVLSAIVTQIETDLLTTSLDKVWHGLDGTSTDYPQALFLVGGAEIESDMNSVLDKTHEMDIWLTAGGEDEVNALIEAIQKLWMDSTLFNALTALGVLDLKPIEHTCEIQEGKDGKWTGWMKFYLLIRHTY